MLTNEVDSVRGPRFLRVKLQSDSLEAIPTGIATHPNAVHIDVWALHPEPPRELHEEVGALAPVERPGSSNDEGSIRDAERST